MPDRVIMGAPANGQSDYFSFKEAGLLPSLEHKKGCS
jgi:hypothetical protein